MKRSFMALCLFALSVFNSGFASGTDINNSVLQSFYMSFAGAKEVSASELNGMIRISFKMDDEIKYAYYTPDAELVVVTKQITLSELPKSLQNDYKNAYAGYFIADIYQFSNDNGTEYYLVIKNETSRLVLKSDSRKWKVFKSDGRF